MTCTVTCSALVLALVMAEVAMVTSQAPAAGDHLPPGLLLQGAAQTNTRGATSLNTNQGDVSDASTHLRDISAEIRRLQAIERGLLKQQAEMRKLRMTKDNNSLLHVLGIQDPRVQQQNMSHNAMTPQPDGSTRQLQISENKNKNSNSNEKLKIQPSLPEQTFVNYPDPKPKTIIHSTRIPTRPTTRMHITTTAQHTTTEHPTTTEYQPTTKQPTYTDQTNITQASTVEPPWYTMLNVRKSNALANKRHRPEETPGPTAATHSNSKDSSNPLSSSVVQQQDMSHNAMAPQPNESTRQLQISENNNMNSNSNAKRKIKPSVPELTFINYPDPKPETIIHSTRIPTQPTTTMHITTTAQHTTTEHPTTTDYQTTTEHSAYTEQTNITQTSAIEPPWYTLLNVRKSNTLANKRHRPEETPASTAASHTNGKDSTVALGSSVLSGNDMGLLTSADTRPLNVDINTQFEKRKERLAMKYPTTSIAYSNVFRPLIPHQPPTTELSRNENGVHGLSGAGSPLSEPVNFGKTKEWKQGPHSSHGNDMGLLTSADTRPWNVNSNTQFEKRKYRPAMKAPMTSVDYSNVFRPLIPHQPPSTELSRNDKAVHGLITAGSSLSEPVHLGKTKEWKQGPQSLPVSPPQAGVEPERVGPRVITPLVSPETFNHVLALLRLEGVNSMRLEPEKFASSQPLLQDQPPINPSAHVDTIRSDRVSTFDAGSLPPIDVSDSVLHSRGITATGNSGLDSRHSGKRIQRTQEERPLTRSQSPPGVNPTGGLGSLTSNPFSFPELPLRTNVRLDGGADLGVEQSGVNPTGGLGTLTSNPFSFPELPLRTNIRLDGVADLGVGQSGVYPTGGLGTLTSDPFNWTSEALNFPEFPIRTNIHLPRTAISSQPGLPSVRHDTMTPDSLFRSALSGNMGFLGLGEFGNMGLGFDNMGRTSFSLGAGIASNLASSPASMSLSRLLASSSGQNSPGNSEIMSALTGEGIDVRSLLGLGVLSPLVNTKTLQRGNSARTGSVNPGLQTSLTNRGTGIGVGTRSAETENLANALLRQALAENTRNRQRSTASAVPFGNSGTNIDGLFNIGRGTDSFSLLSRIMNPRNNRINTEELLESLMMQ